MAAHALRAQLPLRRQRVVAVAVARGGERGRGRRARPGPRRRLFLVAPQVDGGRAEGGRGAGLGEALGAGQVHHLEGEKRRAKLIKGWLDS